MATVSKSVTTAEKVTKPKKVVNPYTTAPPASMPKSAAAPPIVPAAPSGGPIGAVLNTVNKVAAQAQPSVAGSGTGPVSNAPSGPQINNPGTAGSLGNNSGFNGATTTPVGGAIGGYGYTPLGAGTLYNNPQALATDVLKSMGIDNPGLANSLAQTLDPAVAAQFILNNGTKASDAQTLNFANQYMQNMAAPGGRTVDFQDLMNHIMGAGGAYDPATGKASNALAAYLNAGLDPSQQVKAAQGLMGQSMTGENPYFQQGFSNYAKDLGSQYQGAMAKGNPAYSSFVDYLNKSSGIGNWG